jgi:hypothetical protein
MLETQFFNLHMTDQKGSKLRTFIRLSNRLLLGERFLKEGNSVGGEFLKQEATTLVLFY